MIHLYVDQMHKGALSLIQYISASVMCSSLLSKGIDQEHHISLEKNCCPVHQSRRKLAAPQISLRMTFLRLIAITDFPPHAEFGAKEMVHALSELGMVRGSCGRYIAELFALVAAGRYLRRVNLSPEVTLVDLGAMCPRISFPRYLDTVHYSVQEASLPLPPQLPRDIQKLYLSYSL